MVFNIWGIFIYIYISTYIYKNDMVYNVKVYLYYLNMDIWYIMVYYGIVLLLLYDEASWDIPSGEWDDSYNLI